MTAGGSPSNHTRSTIGVDLGGTNLRIAAVDAQGAVVAETRVPTPPDLNAVVHAISQAVDAVTQQAGPVSAIGVGAAGLVDHEGVVHYAPNLPMMRTSPVRQLVADAVRLPAVVDNDANVAAWGEVCHGAARGHRDALVITLGTGVGGGIVVDGRIYRGAHGFGAEVGHWQFDPAGAMCACGERGHWEAEASGSALGRLARERAAVGNAPGVLARANGNVNAVDGHHVGASALAGEPDGVAILGDYAHQVALGFVGLANILDPAVIVVAGGLVELGEVLLAPLRAAFDHHLEGAEFRPSVPIVAAELGEQAGVVGAAALARELVG